MTPTPVKGGDARPEDLRHQPVPPQGNPAAERWEDEGGAPARNLTTPRRAPAPASRSHPFGEGQTVRTITQDEQDRLAARL